MTKQERAAQKRARRAMQKQPSAYALRNAAERKPWSRGPRMPSMRAMREALKRGEKVLPA